MSNVGNGILGQLSSRLTPSETGQAANAASARTRKPHRRQPWLPAPRVVYLLGLHSLQVLPLLGYLAARHARPAAGPRWVLAGALAYFGLVLATLAGALAGRPPGG